MRARLSVTLSVSLLAALAAHEAAAETPRCDAPQVLVVVDHSSSMGVRDPLPDGSQKWRAAVSAITELTSAYESTIDFGLMVFPSAGECTAGELDVPVGPLHARAIASALPGDPPFAGNYTPMSQTLDAASEVAALRDGSRRNFVVLITDGWQWCYPYLASTRFDPVTSTEGLFGLGITTHVIGFGTSVDPLTLNRMANASGTALAGCDPTSDDPGRADNCYHQVGDLAALRAALESIARSVTDEICDGLDNDCDGLVDEGLVRECESPCGAGLETCVAGTWGGCDAIDPEEEVCDGIDNDCDGIIDPNCSCMPGEVLVCGMGEGECETGLQSCVEGGWGDCRGAIGPVPETCDGLDNDCDGFVDEEAECPEGFACVGGECVDVSGPVDPVEPPAEEDLAELPPPGSGCSCRASSASSRSGGLALVLGALALLALRRR